jgi:hypothetical protein
LEGESGIDMPTEYPGMVSRNFRPCQRGSRTGLQRHRRLAAPLAFQRDIELAGGCAVRADPLPNSLLFQSDRW